MTASGGYADALYGQSSGLDGIVGALKGAAATAGAKISVLLFFCSRDPAREFVEWVPAARHPRAAHRGGKQVLSMDGKDGPPIRIAVASDPLAPSIRYALSDCPPKLFKDRFVSLVGRRIPTFSRIVLSSAEMIKILDAVAARGFDVRVKYASAAAQRGEGGLGSRMDYAGRSCRKLRGELEKGVTVRAIRAACGPKGPADGSGATGPAMLTMTHDCRFTASRGARLLFDEMLPQAAKLAASRADLLRSSARTAGNRLPEPLIVNFGRDIFADPTRNRDCIDALASMPRCGISVYCADPYLHASLVDYCDGSSYDIWVLVSDRLALIPQIFASEVSMGRLVNHIFESIGEGKIERYDQGAAGRQNRPSPGGDRRMRARHAGRIGARKNPRRDDGGAS